MRLFGVLAFLLAFAAQPALAQTPPQTAPLRFLEQRIAALATENPGEYGIAALDLRTGATVSFNGHEPFPMASTMKIAVAAMYLAEVDAGRRSLHETIDGVSARLVDTMIRAATIGRPICDALARWAGGGRSWLRAHRLSGIRVDRTIAQLLADRRDLRDIRDSSTPAAMLGLLRLIDSGDALSPSSRALLLDMMRRCATGSNRIRGLLPRGATVENKTGTLNGYTGDVGFLTMPDGRRIAVVFFARGGSNRPAVISTAARAVYDAFGGGGPSHGLAQAAWRDSAAQSAPASACSLGGRPVMADC